MYILQLVLVLWSILGGVLFLLVTVIADKGVGSIQIDYSKLKGKDRVVLLYLLAGPIVYAIFACNYILGVIKWLIKPVGRLLECIIMGILRIFIKDKELK